MKKTWNLINELSSRDVGKSKRITQLNIEGREVTSPREIADTFNTYFSGVGEKLALEIPAPAHDSCYYFKPTDQSFSLKVLSYSAVYRLLSTIDEKKSPGLDNIPNK